MKTIEINSCHEYGINQQIKFKIKVEMQKIQHEEKS